MKAGDKVRLPDWIGSAEVELVDEYRPGIWQVKAENGVQFLISTHVLGRDR